MRVYERLILLRFPKFFKQNNSSIDMNEEMFEKPISENLVGIRIRKVGTLSFAIMFGIVGVFTGLIAFFLGIFVLALFGSAINNMPGQSFDFSIGTFILMPFLFGISGFLSGAIFGFIYNLSAKVGKGIKIYS
jgi:hypothetical protein